MITLFLSYFYITCISFVNSFNIVSIFFFLILRSFVTLTVANFFSLMRVTAKKRKGIRNSAFRILRKDFFFNFPSFMKKEKIFWEIFLLACEKKREIFWISLFRWKKIRKKDKFLSTKMSKISDFLWKEKRFFFHFSLREKKINFPFLMGKGKFFGGFPFSHVGREEIVFPFPFSTVTLKKKISFFSFFRRLLIFTVFEILSTSLRS